MMNKDEIKKSEENLKLIRDGIPIIDEETKKIIAWQEKPDLKANRLFISEEKKKGAPKGNQFWKLRTKHGTDKKLTPKDLLLAVEEFATLIEENPLIETVISGGEMFEVPKMRAMTIERFCIFAKITPQTLNNYGEDKDYLGIVTYVKDLFRAQNIEGAAANLLNTNLIARYIGLKDKSEIDQNIKREAPLVIKVDNKKLDL